MHPKTKNTHTTPTTPTIGRPHHYPVRISNRVFVCVLRRRLTPSSVSVFNVRPIRSAVPFAAPPSSPSCRFSCSLPPGQAEAAHWQAAGAGQRGPRHVRAGGAASGCQAQAPAAAAEAAAHRALTVAAAGRRQLRGPGLRSGQCGDARCGHRHRGGRRCAAAAGRPCGRKRTGRFLVQHTFVSGTVFGVSGPW